ncbi:MAG: transcription antitermination factor NusB [Candidatus Margulisbacteria bacterium GWF2_35_9]|nr:MAG: transcription antitermination factor NusB [Candidatus Margulisbacteria bacterium GWF2_35_9]
MGKRSTARKLAMQALYQYHIQKADEEAILDYTLNKDTYIGETKEFAEKIFRGIFDNLKLIDNLITEYSIDWKIDRIAIIDKAILQVGIWEMLYTDTSLKVIISESIDLVRKYSEFDAIKFVNGVLGSVARNREKLKKN